QAIELWDGIVRDLGLPITHVTVHPDRPKDSEIWRKLGYSVLLDRGCSWSAGPIHGYCCELFVGELELGNLVNPLDHSVDVGFGLERMIQVLEQKERITETSLFRQDLPPIVADHTRTLLLMKENGVEPGSKGRESICRKLIQRCLRLMNDPVDLVPELSNWWQMEETLLQGRLERGRRRWKKFKHRSPEFWLETFGLTREDVQILKEEDEKSGF
ncbi:MAG: hypothetical protein P1V97_29535, partial [Planctomycetota bacterium]|nr:hypothetical protein [Planctomycetota bacterium]